MVSPLVYNILCRRNFPDNLRRAFLAILAEYDLLDFTVINRYYLVRTYHFDIPDEITQAITHFTNAGILERGPSINGKATYRIRPGFIASNKDIQRIEDRMTYRAQREALGLKC